jgi:hypothetical protein
MRARQASRWRERSVAAGEPEEDLHDVGGEARFLQIDLEPECALPRQPGVEPARRADRIRKKARHRMPQAAPLVAPPFHPGQTARPLSARDPSAASTHLPSGIAASAPRVGTREAPAAAPRSVRAMGSASYAACCRITRDRVGASPAIPRGDGVAFLPFPATRRWTCNPGERKAKKATPSPHLSATRCSKCNPGERKEKRQLRARTSPSLVGRNPHMA